MGNPHLEMEGFPCWFVSEGATMTAESGFSGVSSFGVSGTNGHCLAYGKNVMNSRANRTLNYKSLFLEKIEAAKPIVHTHHEGWEDWQNFGTPHEEQTPGTQYQVEILPDGGTTWRVVERPVLRNLEGPFHITGSFNNWRMEQMMEGGIAGLFAAEIEFGETGQETFQVCYNEDTAMTYYPSEANCEKRTVGILGPGEAPSKDHAWVVRGEPNTSTRIEFFVFKNGSRATVNWVPVKD